MPPPPIRNPSLVPGDAHLRGRAGVAFECDRCGRPVPRELASPIRRGDGEPVVLCADCEHGAD